MLCLAALCALPEAAAQAAIAWVGLALRTGGGLPLEAAPRSVLGVFFAPYWFGSAQQCGEGGSEVSGGGEVGGGGCTLCVFPAAAALAHAAFTAVYVAALALVCARLAAAVLNARLRRRLRLHQAAHSALAVAGVCGSGGGGGSLGRCSLLSVCL